MESQLFMGCDISQDSFNFCLRNSTEIVLQGQIVNGAKPIRSWIKEMEKKQKFDLSKILFCLEHTGVYSAILLRELNERSLSICLESAMNIKLSLGLTRGKSDKVDAQRIAEYALRNADRLSLWKPKRRVIERLQLLIRMRDRLIKARTDLARFNQDSKRFLPAEDTRLLVAGTKQALDGIARDIKKADESIESIIRSDENLTRLNKLITSINGVGLITSSAIIVRTNEFKDFTEPKKFACTAGVAPFEHTSGKSVKGKTRVSHFAHKDLKRLLHMCAVGCISRKGELRSYYDRKIAQGKNKMSVLNAIRNKIVHRAFAVVRDNVMYQKDYQYHLRMV